MGFNGAESPSTTLYTIAIEQPSESANLIGINSCVPIVCRLRDDVVSVVVAVRAGEDDDAEFHASISTL
jgi:hypothetical protein